MSGARASLTEAGSDCAGAMDVSMHLVALGLTPVAMSRDERGISQVYLTSSRRFVLVRSTIIKGRARTCMSGIKDAKE